MSEDPVGGDRPVLPPKALDIDGIEQAATLLLQALGQTDKAEVMRNTPRRIAELYAESLNPSYVDVELELKTFDNPGIHDLVLVNDVHYVSLCEHHLAPTFGVAHLAYIPDERIVGYSKLKKALNYLARQPQLNERLLAASLDFVEERLQPRGIALALRSVHCCIALRANAPMQELVTVADFRGELREAQHRSVFWASVFANKPVFLGQ